ncbi:MAG: hypothetical protein D6820_06715 [Lentisphaerae bacterium]|nr:MAG: hypothetical protein D6820_06715 [Lentisphaerota bacterium]
MPSSASRRLVCSAWRNQKNVQELAGPGFLKIGWFSRQYRVCFAFNNETDKQERIIAEKNRTNL